MILHFAGCRTIGAGTRRARVRLTGTSVKLCGDRAELDAFAREKLGTDLRHCGLCLRSDPAERPESPSDHSRQPDQPSVTQSPAHKDKESSGSVLVLKGEAAKAANRKTRPWFLAYLVLVVGSVWGGAGWNASEAQTAYLAFGTSFLWLAALVWRRGIIAIWYERFGDDITYRELRSPVRRAIATPILIAAALVLDLAATPTGIGSAMAPFASAGMVIWKFVPAALSLGLYLALVVLLFVGLFRREQFGNTGCALALITVPTIVVAVIALLNGGLHHLLGLLESYYAPLIDMWHLVTG
jgi:hypothetical protein